MAKIAIVTDSNSGLTQAQAKEMGIHLLPMPFYINGELFIDGITLTQEQFYEYLAQGADISTSQPAVGDVLDFWDALLKEYDQIVHIPMSSGLSGTYETAAMLAKDYDGKVEVVNNQRIAATQTQSALDAKRMAEEGATAEEIRIKLEETKFDSSIYIMVDTLTYLKKGGRLTPAVAAIGTLLRLKPVLQIQGDKLDAFAKARNVKQAKKIMIEAVQKDSQNRFGGGLTADNCILNLVYSGTDTAAIEAFRDDVMAAFPGHTKEDLVISPMSLSVACHIGPGAIAITCCKKMYND